jgi:hypothetical protein
MKVTTQIFLTDPSTGRITMPATSKCSALSAHFIIILTQHRYDTILFYRQFIPDNSICIETRLLAGRPEE